MKLHVNSLYLNEMRHQRKIIKRKIKAISQSNWTSPEIRAHPRQREEKRRRRRVLALALQRAGEFEERSHKFSFRNQDQRESAKRKKEKNARQRQRRWLPLLLLLLLLYVKDLSFFSLACKDDFYVNEIATRKRRTKLGRVSLLLAFLLSLIVILIGENKW